MREHLFRGKIKDGKWVEGSLIRAFDKFYQKEVAEIVYQEWEPVSPDYPFPRLHKVCNVVMQLLEGKQ